MNVRNGPSPVTYSIIPKRRLNKVLKLDSLTGTITLRKDLKTFLKLRNDGTRRLNFKVNGCQKIGRKKNCAIVNVRIIALRRNFGDEFVEEALKHVTPEKLVNRIFKVSAKTVTPSFLLRVFRRIPKSSENITMIDAKQQLSLDYVKRKVLRLLSLRKL